ncbi:hypothetical protein EKD04_015500 [Chloroflexales bacterium ZM16-3]|nr:hypothetical protein [Chloroflexales bacterium ZM16-3]
MNYLRSPQADADQDFELLETLLLDEGAYLLFDRHLQRLLASARYLRFFVSASAVTDALRAYAQALPHGRWRVRMRVSRVGGVLLERYPVQPLPPPPLTVALSRSPVVSDDIFLAHKTTHRAVYDSRRADHPDVFDVLLWNEQGELTEFTTGNLVVELDGSRLTPACASGLLAGTLRAELLDRGEIREETLPCTVLQRASRLWFINSVRGQVEVQIKGAYEDDYH